MARVDVVPWSMATRCMGMRLRLSPAALVRHETGQRFALLARQSQAELRATPQHVVYGLGPFEPHQIAHFRRREVAAEEGAEILAPARGPEDVFDARSIGAEQAARMRR